MARRWGRWAVGGRRSADGRWPRGGDRRLSERRRDVRTIEGGRARHRRSLHADRPYPRGVPRPRGGGRVGPHDGGGGTMTRVALIADLVEENWPSMDLVADMALASLRDEAIDVRLVRPTMVRRFSRQGDSRSRQYTADRFVHRLWDYPHAPS